MLTSPNRRLALTALTTAGAIGLLAAAACAADRIPVTSIWLLGADGGVLAKPRGAVFSVDPAWSPDGTKLAFAKGDVAVVNADGTGFKRLPRTAQLDETDPSWSPDGSRLAFRSEGGGPSGLYVINADGSDRRRIARNVRGGEESSINWSPDGTQVAFNTAPSSSSGYQIYLMSSDGSGRRPLTNTGNNADAAWSPNGTTLVFAGARERDEEPNGLYTLRLDGSERTFLADGAAALHHPVWSPDGSRIAFLRAGSKRATAHVIRPDGTGLKRLIRAGVWSDAPAWSPDGTRIALTRLSLSSGGSSRRCAGVTVRMTPTAHHLRAHDLSCRKARSVTRDWLYAVQAGEGTRRVAGFSCRRDRRQGRVRCASGGRVLRFRWRPAP